MYHEGIINDSNINMILSSEMAEMINYAYSYFNVSRKQKALTERKIEAAYRSKIELMKSKRELENCKKELKAYEDILGVGKEFFR